MIIEINFNKIIEECLISLKDLVLILIGYFMCRSVYTEKTKK